MCNEPKGDVDEGVALVAGTLVNDSKSGYGRSVLALQMRSTKRGRYWGRLDCEEV